MLQLSLSWLGRGPVAVSPWQLLLVVGTSLFLARILAWISAFYDNYCRLRCFPQPPSRHWFWGHLNLVKNNEEGLQLLAEMSHQFQDIHLCWIGIFYPILRLIHPKFIGPILQAPAAVAPKEMIFYGFLKPWLGDGLLMSAGEKWNNDVRVDESQDRVHGSHPREVDITEVVAQMCYELHAFLVVLHQGQVTPKPAWFRGLREATKAAAVVIEGIDPGQNSG